MKTRKKVEEGVFPVDDPEVEVFVVPQEEAIPVEWPQPLEPAVPVPYEPAVPEPQRRVNGR